MRFYNLLYLLCLCEYLQVFLQVNSSKINKNLSSKQEVLNYSNFKHLYDPIIASVLLDKNLHIDQTFNEEKRREVQIDYDLISMGLRNSRILSDKLNMMRGTFPACPQCTNQVYLLIL